MPVFGCFEGLKGLKMGVDESTAIFESVGSGFESPRGRQYMGLATNANPILCAFSTSKAIQESSVGIRNSKTLRVFKMVDS